MKQFNEVDMCELAPIILFVYNRPKHTRQVLDALSNAIDADKSELFVFSDETKIPSLGEEVRKVREIISDPIYVKRFKSVKIILREHNYGLERNILAGVSEIIREYGRVIVLEDDIVVSEDFLTFMNKALDVYKDDDRIWSISTNTPCSKALENSEYDILWSYRAGCWGWATWADRWSMVDWDVQDYYEFEHDKRKQRQFNRGGRDLSWMLGLQQKGFIQSWAIRWCYSQYRRGMITLFPKNAKSQNIGTDGSGTNSGISKEKIPLFENKPEDISKWQYSPDDYTLQKVFARRFRYRYWRQRIGAIWYVLTDYDDVMVRR